MLTYFRGTILVALACITPAVGAQQPAPLGSALVTLIAGPSPSRGTRTEVVRRAQRAPQNLVIVDKNATAEDLAAALAMINGLRARYGDSLTNDFRARPASMRVGPTWHKSNYRTWLVQQLVRLRSAPQGSFPTFGVVRSVQITLPAPTSGFTATSSGHP